MTESYTVLSKNILGLRTNIPRFRWSYGINPPQTNKEAYDACDLRLNLEVKRTEDLHSFAESGKYHYFSGTPGQDKIIYERPFFLRSRLQLTAEGLLSKTPSLTVNTTYHRFITHRFMNLHSIGYILTDVASLLLLRAGYAPLHCSSFSKDGACVVIFAPPNTGKTLSTMIACLEHGAQFLAEDLAITDGQNIFAVPWTSTFRYYSRVEQRGWAQLVHALILRVPVLELLPLVKARPISDYLDSAQILDNSAATHVLILERGTEQVEKLSRAEALRKILNLNRYEFNYMKAPLNVAYEYFNPSLNIDGAQATEVKTLESLIGNAHELLLVRTQDPSRYTHLVLNALGAA